MNAKPEHLLGLIPEERITQFEIPRPSNETVQTFLDFPDMAGLVSRAMDRLGIVGSIPAHVLTPLTPGKRIVGPAITVRNVPARYPPYYGWQEELDTQLGEREAYYLAEPGDVVVIDSGGRTVCSNLGPNSAVMARSHGIVGAVVDGVVTGPEGIRQGDFPVWCRGGTTVTGHHRVETIEINGIIACGVVQVRAGDLIVADDSGISIVPEQRLMEVLEASRALAVKGRALADAVEAGKSPEDIRQTFQRLIMSDPGAA